MVVFPTAVLLCLTLMAWADTSEMLRVGRVIDIDGPLLMTNRMTEKSWFQGYAQMDTFHRERLKADPRTSATMEFNIGGRAVISPGTEIEIVSTESVKVVEIKSGTFWAKFDKQPEEIQIKTSGGVMGIEGTEFFVEADDEGETSLTVVEGQVRVNSGDDEQVVTDGEEANFRRGVRNFGRFSAASGLTVAERREAAFKRLRLEGTPFQKYVLTRGLSKRRARRFNRAFFQQTALRRSTGSRPSPRPRRRPARLQDRDFSLTSVEQMGGKPAARWTVKPGVTSSVTLSTDPAGDDLIWSAQTNQSSFQYPEYGPELEAGQKYFLIVTPLRQDGTALVDPTGEEIVATSDFLAEGHVPTFSSLTGLEAAHEDGPPSFEWVAGDSTSGYQLSILRDETLVWMDETEDTRYEFPLSARPLEPGTYRVLVEGFDLSGVKKSESESVQFQTEGWNTEGLEGPPRD